MYADSNQKVKGPDGKWHDAMIPGNPTVQAGKVTVTVYNYDTSMHTINSDALGLAEQIPPAHGNTPGKITFTFTAAPGNYQWYCVEPCDPWAMATTAIYGATLPCARDVSDLALALKLIFSTSRFCGLSGPAEPLSVALVSGKERGWAPRCRSDLALTRADRPPPPLGPRL